MLQLDYLLVGSEYFIVGITKLFNGSFHFDLINSCCTSLNTSHLDLSYCNILIVGKLHIVQCNLIRYTIFLTCDYWLNGFFSFSFLWMVTSPHLNPSPWCSPFTRCPSAINLPQGPNTIRLLPPPACSSAYKLQWQHIW